MEGSETGVEWSAVGLMLPRILDADGCFVCVCVCRIALFFLCSHALIDTGALITGMSNKEVAAFLLKNGLFNFEGCVYLDEQDVKMIL